MTGIPTPPPTPAGRPRLLIYIVLAVIGVAIAGAVVSSNNDEGGSSGSSSNDSQLDARQQLYNAFFRQARTDLASTGPELFCDPDYWLLVADQVTGATGSDKAILQLAMGDTCNEAGHLEGAVYSAYYADH